ncbi:MAG: hypothetical protein AAB441_03120 [Patescibacteria group bacterium]
MPKIELFSARFLFPKSNIHQEKNNHEQSTDQLENSAGFKEIKIIHIYSLK